MKLEVPPEEFLLKYRDIYESAAIHHSLLTTVSTSQEKQQHPYIFKR